MRPETKLQREMVKHLRDRGYIVAAVPNGAVLKGNKAERARQMSGLVADGLLAGFPDMLVYASQGRMGHIEVKCPGKYQQATQRAVQGELQAKGHHYAVCRSINDVDETLKHWGWA